MFAYCNNNPVISADYNGYDAIILLDDDFMTHIGIMVQDENGAWSHFYWGTGAGGSSSNNHGSSASSGMSSGYVATFFGNVPAETWCEPYTGELTIDAINASGQYIDYEDMCYLSGDFSACLEEMNAPSGEYNLWNNNCSQVSLRILAKADTNYQQTLIDHSSTLIPQNAFRKVKRMASIIDILSFILGSET